MTKTNVASKSIEKELQRIPNVGSAISSKIVSLGIQSIEQLASSDAEKLYDRLCVMDGVQHDVCLLDVFVSAVEFAKTGSNEPWWEYSRKRKQEA